MCIWHTSAHIIFVIPSASCFVRHRRSELSAGPIATSELLTPFTSCSYPPYEEGRPAGHSHLVSVARPSADSLPRWLVAGA